MHDAFLEIIFGETHVCSLAIHLCCSCALLGTRGCRGYSSDACATAGGDTDRQIRRERRPDLCLLPQRERE